MPVEELATEVMMEPVEVVVVVIPPVHCAWQLPPTHCPSVVVAVSGIPHIP